MRRPPRVLSRPAGWLPIPIAVLCLVAAPPPAALGCACGCGVFEVGTSAMLPTSEGLMLSLDYDFMNQNRNWSGRSSALAGANDDKRIRTHFVTASAQYTVNRTWTLSARIPYWSRSFATSGEDGVVATFDHSALGDARLSATYTGFSEDLSTGLSLGVKLPTGDDSYADFDRDTEIGTGSTDLLLGGYHRLALSNDRTWNGFVQGSWEQAVTTRGDYRPGDEADGAAGVYKELAFGDSPLRLSPLLQVVASARARDRGVEADAGNSGYARLLLAPGAELKLPGVRVYADVELPVYQRVNGNQLVAPRLFKLIVSYGP